MRNRLFNVVKIKKPKTNVFDLSHEKKLSFNMGELIPIMCQEVVPGDKFRVNSEMLLRLCPMLSPMMHRINAYVHYFFVPNRLVWENWENFITGGEDGLYSATFPTMEVNESVKSYFGLGTLPDYLGIPVPQTGTITDPLTISALPFRAYQLIFNEYYRDQNLQNEAGIDFGDTVGYLAETTTLRRRCWEKDYFTSALPWTEKGGEVNIPGDATYLANSVIRDIDGHTNSGVETISGLDGNLRTSAEGGQGARIQNIDEIEINVNDFRRSLRLQEWLEKNARAGSRYVEQLLSHFGVKSSDGRLQRPEYLGGSKNPIVVSEVLNTSATASEVQGEMTGHGIGVGNLNGFSKYFEEHGFIIGIMSVIPRTAYQQGIEKIFLKTDKFDYYWPEFANLGEEAVKISEVYHNYLGVSGHGDGVFGYQARYADYKFKQSMVHGDFKDSLSHWHMGRIFTSEPSLNSSFVDCQPTTRVFAVTDGTDKVYGQIYNSVRAIRPMPVFGTPLI